MWLIHLYKDSDKFIFWSFSSILFLLALMISAMIYDENSWADYAAENGCTKTGETISSMSVVYIVQASGSMLPVMQNNIEYEYLCKSGEPIVWR